MNLKSIMIPIIVLISLPFSMQVSAEQVTVENIGLATPESVEYYAAQDVYLVTNINGSPFEADDNGFISKISPSGKVLDLKWIDGAKADIRLNAPKGAAINRDILFVADCDEVHLFHLPSGKQKASVKINGSVFLNGITPGEEGSVYVTDSSFLAGFKSGTADAVYQVYPNGNYKAIIKDTTLKTPNGIYRQGKDLVIGSARSANIFRLKPDGQLSNLPTPSGMDGLLILPDGDYLFSSWKDKAVYRMDNSGHHKVIAQPLVSPADMGYDSKRHRALVPIFMQNKLVFITL